MKEALPAPDDGDSFLTDMFDSINVGMNSMPWRALGAEFERKFSSADYGVFSKFIEIRDSYVAKYCSIVKSYVNAIVEEFEKNRVYIDQDELLYEVISDSSSTKRIEEYANYIRNHKQQCASYNIKYYNKVFELYRAEKADLSKTSGIAGAIYQRLTAPLNSCFIEMFGSEILDKVLPSTNNSSPADLPTAVTSCSEKLFSNSKLIEALADGIWYDVFNCFVLKYNYCIKNGIGEYERITKEEMDKASSLYKIFSERNIPEEDEKPMMIEALTSDPCTEKYYFAILDKYHDPDGELQKFAEINTIDVVSHIEKNLMSVYENGDIGTLESTLELKEKILSEQTKYHLEDSKALREVTYRQFFLELSRKAGNMTEEAIVENYISIKNGDNTFAEDKGDIIPDDDCILILSRAFRKINAAKYHDIIRNLGLTDDTTEGDKNYAFYEEGENYISFENECEKVVGSKIERDENLAEQNYSEDKLSSDEIILGYFKYTRAMDIIGDGKSLIITNKRIYTKDEKFTDLEKITICKPTKKLLLNYLILETTDGNNIQLPVSKEIMIQAADMINRLMAALKGTEYIVNSVEVEKSQSTQNIDKAKDAVFNAASNAKKGFGSLMNKLKDKGLK